MTRVAYWHGETAPAALRRVLRNFRFVADTYGMVVPAGSQRRTSRPATAASAWPTSATTS